MNTLCAAVMEGTRAVEDDSGHEQMCIKTEKVVDILRQDGSSWRRAPLCTFQGQNRTLSRMSHEEWAILFVGSVRNTMVHVMICRSLDTEHVPKSLDSEVEHRESLAQTEEYKKTSPGLEACEQCAGELKTSSGSAQAFSTSMRKTLICW